MTIQTNFYTDNPNTVERSFRIDCPKTSVRQLTEWDYPTPVGSIVYWCEHSGRRGKRLKTFRCGEIRRHFARAGNVAQYEVDLLWTTSNRENTVKIDVDCGLRSPFVSVVENGKLSRTMIAKNIESYFGVDLETLLANPGKKFPAQKRNVQYTR